MKAAIRNLILDNRNKAMIVAVAFDVVCLGVILYLVFG